MPALELVAGLRAVAERLGHSVAELAVAWTLRWPAVSGTIAGARRPEQLEGWLGAGNVTLAPEDLDEIAVLIRDTGAGSGPTRPPDEREYDDAPARPGA